EGRLLCGLEHASAACSERRRELPSGHQERIVPRNDLTSDANRFLQCKTHGIVRNRVDVSKNFGRQSPVILEASSDVGDIEFRFDNGFATVASLDFGQQSGVLTNLLRQAE